MNRFLTHTRPWQVVLVFTLLYLSATLLINDGDLKTFVRLGSCFSDCDGVNETPCLEDETPCMADCHIFDTCDDDCIECTNCEAGYDGQFVYYIARNPSNASPCIDVPAYRYQRILLSAMGRVVALGQEPYLPLAFVLINLIALVWSTALMEDLLNKTEASPWFALVYGLFFGMVASVRVSTTEPLAYGLIVGAIWFSQRHPKQVIITAILVALAILAKEVTGLFVGGFGLYYLLQKRFRDATLFGIIALLPFVAWQIYLYEWLGEWGIGSGGENATGFEIIPYGGVWRILTVGDTFLQGLIVFLLLGVLLIIPTAVIPSVWGLYATGKRLWQHRQPSQWSKIDLYTCLFFATVIIMPFIPLSTFAEPFGITRFMVGQIIMHILFSATHYVGKRALNYSPLWTAWLLLMLING